MKNNIFFYQGKKKLGNTVGYTVKGKQLFRAYQGNVSNPKTPAQTLQRAKFTLLIKRGQALRPIIRLGFRYMSDVRKSTTFNAFFHENYPNITGSVPEAIGLTPEDMVLSKGPLSNAIYSGTIDASSVPNQVSITVTDSGVIDPAETNTKLRAVIYCEETQEAVMSLAANRTAGNIDVAVPSRWNGLEVHAYAFTQSEDGKQSSDSIYIGHSTIS